MKWIKLDCDFVQDKRIIKLRQEMGSLGMGIYIDMLMAVAFNNNEAAHISTVRASVDDKISRQKKDKVLYDYGLFEIDAAGFVKSASDHPYACDHGGDHAEDYGRDYGRDYAEDHGQLHNSPPVIKNRTEHNRTKESGKKVSHGTEQDSDLEEREKEFCSGFCEHYPTLAKMKEPLTLRQYETLLKTYSCDQIRNKLRYMDNKVDIEKNYKSVYRVLLNWLNR